MRLRNKVVFLAAVVLLNSSICSFGQDAVRRLDGFQRQLEGWERYRDEQQKELHFDRQHQETVRTMADIPAKEKEFAKASKDVLDGAPGAVKDAFKDAMSTHMDLGVAKDMAERTEKYGKQLSAFNDALSAQANQDRLSARLATLAAEIAKHERNIAIANQVIAFSRQQIATLQSSIALQNANMGGWLQQVLGAVVQAAARQEAQREAERREAERRAEEARRAEARQQHDRPETHERTARPETERHDPPAHHDPPPHHETPAHHDPPPQRDIPIRPS